MKYLPENYYLGNPKFPYGKAVIVVAKTIAQWCNGYKAKLIFPKKAVKEKLRRGALPRSAKEREKFVGNLVEWIFRNSDFGRIFKLFLYSGKDNVKFEYHDEEYWCLNLNRREFKQLRNELIRHGLPKDLFINESEIKCVGTEPGFFGRLLRKAGFVVENKKCYSNRK